MMRLCPGAAKPERWHINIWFSPTTNRRARTAGAAIPGTTPDRPFHAGLYLANGIDDCLFAIFPLTVPTPFPDIPQHIIEPLGRGFLAARRMRADPMMIRVLSFRPIGAIEAVIQRECHAAIAAIPGNAIQNRGIIRPQDLQGPLIGGRFRAGATGVFPLGLRGQHQIETGYSVVDFRDEFVHLIPIHRIHGTIRGLEMTRVFTGYRLPQRLRARGVEQPVTSRQNDSMSWSLVFPSTRFVRGGAHLECPGENPTQALHDILQGEFDEDAMAILSPTAGPSRGSAMDQRMPGGIDSGEG